LISFSAYAIIAIGKMIKLNSLVTQQKASEVASPRLFYSVLARVAYSPGWLPATIFYPAIWFEKYVILYGGKPNKFYHFYNG